MPSAPKSRSGSPATGIRTCRSRTGVSFSPIPGGHAGPGPAEGVGMILVAPVLIEHASDELKRQFIRPTVTGEISWCQLFSEPGAGSDLAGLQTRAERDG